MASAAVLTLPTESVVLISINSLKMSWESCRVASSICADDAELMKRTKTGTQSVALGLFNPGFSFGNCLKLVYKLSKDSLRANYAAPAGKSRPAHHHLSPLARASARS